ncbi:MAG: aminoacyl-tRNA hydrolase [Bacteroidia bacterium]
MKYLIVGLGNIGEEYKDTRHNIGFMIVDALAEKLEVAFDLEKLAMVTIGKLKGRQLILIKPTTYMNLSGKAVRFYAQKYEVPLENILVITDDIALPFAKSRIKPSGSDGGHNGLKSINELLGTQQYPRLRFGVGNDFYKGKQAEYVLAPFKEKEQEELASWINECVLGIVSFVFEGIAKTMNTFNKK